MTEFSELLDTYNGGVEPLESWTTRDIVRLVELGDAELQRRAFEKEFEPFYEVIP
jgi:hypothetical protein